MAWIQSHSYQLHIPAHVFNLCASNFSSRKQNGDISIPATVEGLMEKSEVQSLAGAWPLVNV